MRIKGTAGRWFTTWSKPSKKHWLAHTAVARFLALERHLVPKEGDQMAAWVVEQIK